MSISKKHSLFLMLAAVIWGAAFVAQSAGGDVIGPYSFTCLRSFIGVMALSIVITIFDKTGISHKPVNKAERKTLLIGGLCCGLTLCIATNFQQLGISMGASTGKAGFITACYIVLVPIVGILFKRKCPPIVWVSVLITLVGLYLLCMKDSFGTIGLPDILLLLCAFTFTLQILFIDKYSPITDGVRLSRMQFLVSGVFTLPLMLIMETGKLGLGTWAQNLLSWDAMIPLLYAGVMSSGVAYTFQILGQRDVNPTVASVIMSLESVFSAIFGFLILGEKLAAREIAGCALIFAAVLLAQMPTKNDKKE